MSIATPVRETVIAGEPRVQLLPPSVRQRAKTRSARQMMVLLVVLALAVAGAGVTWGYFSKVQADVGLEAATARTQQILAEQAEYAEASQLAALVATTLEAQRTVTSNEIDWADLTAAIGAFIPEGTTMAQVAYQAPAPWEPPLAPEGPLRAERIATVSITIIGPSYLQGALFAQAVVALEGFSDVVITGTTFEDGLYRTTVSLSLDADVLALRFATDDETGDASSTEDETTEGVKP